MDCFKKALRTLFITALLTVLMLGVFAGYFLGSETGLNHSILLAKPFVPTSFNIGRAKGCWLGKVELQQVEISEPEHTLRIDRLDFSLSLSKLLYGILHFDSLHIDHIAFKTRATPPAKKKAVSPSLATLTMPTLPTLPLNILWQDFTLKKMTIDDRTFNDIHSQGYVIAHPKQTKILLKHFQGTFQSDPIVAQGELHWDKKIFNVKQFSIRFQENYVQANGTLGQSNNLTWKIHLFKESDKNYLHATGKVLGRGAQLSVQAQVRANILYGDFALQQLQADIALSDTGKSDNNIRVQSKKLAYSGGQFTGLRFLSLGKLNQQNYRLELTPYQKLPIQLAGTWQLNHPAELFKQNINGHLTFTSPNLNSLHLAIDDLSSTRGALNGSLEFAGTLSEPYTRGTITLTDGELTIPSLGLAFDHSQLTLHKPSLVKDDFTITGVTHTHNNPIAISGSGNLNPQTLQANIRLQGENVQIMNNSEFKIWASPTLEIAYTPEKTLITGDIAIPRALITPKSLTDQDNISSDFVFVQSKQANAQTTSNTTGSDLPFYLDVNLQLGKSIHFRYKDFSAEFGGKLRVHQEPQQPMLAQGELVILQGEYKTHGQTLKMSNGRLLFLNDSIEDPRLDISATKSVTVQSKKSVIPATGLLRPETIKQAPTLTNVDVGIHITGRTTKPNIRLYSSPMTLTSGEILSYLLLGHPLSQASHDSAGLLMQAAYALKLKGSDKAGITEQLQNWLKIDDIGLRSVNRLDPEKNTFTPRTALNLGKKLSPRLYLDYTVGLFDPINIIKLRYQIKDGWMVETEKDNKNTGIDLFYHIETD